MLQLTTPQERSILAVATLNACPEGLNNNNIHLQLDFLSGLTNINSNQLLDIFSRLDCLGIKSRCYESDEHRDKHFLSNSKHIIEIKFVPNLEYYPWNATVIMEAIFHIIYDCLCPCCAEKAVEQLDFSVLSTLAGFDEIHSTS